MPDGQRGDSSAGTPPPISTGSFTKVGTSEGAGGPLGPTGATPLSDQGSYGSVPTRKRASTAGSKIVRKPGKREMKEYPLSEDELNGLTAIGLLATFLFTASGFALGLCIDIWKDMSLASDIPAKQQGIWTTMWWVTAVVFLLTLVGGVLAMVWGKSRLNDIKASTQHDE
jgi:hypothetical protein